MPDERREEIDTAALKRSLDALAIYSQHVALHKRGAEFVARCLWHAPDNNPSLTFYEHDGEWRYRCVACPAAGNVIAFVQAVLGCDQAAAGVGPRQMHP